MATYQKNVFSTCENWPLSPVYVWHSRLFREHSFPKVISDGNCILGNPEFASRLFSWFHDAQESVALQMWLHYDPKDGELRSRVCLELVDAESGQEEEWSHDLDSLIQVYDAANSWSDSMHKLPFWHKGAYLQINTPPDEEDYHSPRLIEDMLHIIRSSRSSIAVVVSLYFDWEAGVDGLRTIHVPPHIMHNPRLRSRWLRMARKRHEGIRHLPVRSVRRRIAVLSTDRISSLVRQSVFRGLAGTSPAYASWFNLKTEHISSITESPLSAIHFELPKGQRDRISVDEARSMLTSNHCTTRVPREFENDHDDIPF